MNFLQFAEKILKEENQPLTQFEIWEIGKKKGYDTQLNSSGKTPWQTIGARIYVDLKDNPDTIFIKLKLKPTKFFLKSLSRNIDFNKLEKEADIIEKREEIGFNERALHKYLSYYVYTYQFIYTKTIFHEESNKKKYSQWLHPDIAGVYFPIEKWESEVLDLSKEVGSIGIKLFSYELKRKLSFNNLRESYFQAVSNSSWANEGYLVAAEIDQDEEFQQELKRLSNSFGIGLIRLDIDDPDSSETIYPARLKESVDIETINRIAQVNHNFKEFLKRIKSDLTSNEIRKEKYDKIFDIENLLKREGLK